MKLVKINCPLCNFKLYRELFKVGDLRYPSESFQKFTLVRCKNCGLLYVNPRPLPKETGRFYLNDYYSSENKKKLDFKKIISIIANIYRISTIKSILEFRKKGRVLDIGCGDGNFLFTLKRINKNFNLLGIDVSSEACKLTKEKGIKVINKELEDCKFSSNYFEIITMWHVLEHVYNPQFTIKETKRILKENGLLLIEVPNIESFAFKVFRKYWVHLDVPRHLTHWNIKTLSALLKKNGFKIIKFRYFYRINFSLSYYRSFLRFLAENNLNFFLIRSISFLILTSLNFIINLFLPRKRLEILRIWAIKN